MTNTTKLTKTQIKIIAKDAVAEGRLADALLILTDCYDGRRFFDRESALAEMAPAPQAKVGDILYTSWGYDQTNVDFYQVVRVKGSAVYVREIGANFHDSLATRGADYVSAVRGAFIGAETRHTISKSYNGIGYTLKIKDHSAWLWDGKPKSQTASGYGH
jgi:hypothetical protein